MRQCARTLLSMTQSTGGRCIVGARLLIDIDLFSDMSCCVLKSEVGIPALSRRAMSDDNRDLTDFWVLKLYARKTMNDAANSCEGRMKSM